MALSILDGNQSATTLSTIVTSGQHIPAHTVVSLGTQAITNISSAISGSTVCVGNLGLLQSTVATEGLSASGSFIKIGGHTGTSTTGNIVHVSSVGALRVDGSVYTQPVSIASVTIGNTVTIAGTVTANPTGTQTIAGTVTANDSGALSIVNSSTVTKADVKFTTIAGAYNPTDVASSYVVRPLSISSTGKLLIDASADSGGGSVVGYDGNAFIRVAQSPQSVVTVGSIPAISGTVTIGSALPAGTNRIGVVTIGAGTVTIGAGTAQIGSVTASISGTVPVSISSVTVGNSVTIGNFPASQAVTFGQAIVSASNITGLNNSVGTDGGTPATTNFIKIGGHQDGANSVEHIVHVSAGGAMKVDASDSTVTFGVIRGTVTVGNSVTIGSLPSISGTVTANTFALQGTAVTTSNFTSTTASTVLASFNATREVLTIFNEGAGNLHICAGATCTTIAYQVRLSAGDYYEVPNHQTTITHSAVFATAGTARVTQVS
jgi:hypothetical protein